mgnify:CR=1 FL=1
MPPYIVSLFDALVNRFRKRKTIKKDKKATKIAKANDNKKDKKPKRFAPKKGSVITPLPKTNSAAKQRKCLLYKLLLCFKIKSPFFKGNFRQSRLKVGIYKLKKPIFIWFILLD